MLFARKLQLFSKISKILQLFDIYDEDWTVDQIIDRELYLQKRDQELTRQEKWSGMISKTRGFRPPWERRKKKVLIFHKSTN